MTQRVVQILRPAFSYCITMIVFLLMNEEESFLHGVHGIRTVPNIIHRVHESANTTIRRGPQKSNAALMNIILSPEQAARAIHSRSFLQELVHWKDTCKEEYNTQPSETTTIDHYHIVEYTGRLWFLRKTPIRFQESVRFVGVSSGGATIECITKYKKSQSCEWIDCSRLLCTFSSTINENSDLEMNMKSELLVALPFLPFRNKITYKICDTFGNAVQAFLGCQLISCT